MNRTYKLRTFTNGRTSEGKPFTNYSITLPTQLAEALVEQMGREIAFEVELTDEGILYRPVVHRSNVPDELPAWATGNGPAPAEPEAPAAPKRRGRPPGSKNKPKADGNGKAAEPAKPAPAKPKASGPKAPKAPAAPKAPKAPTAPKAAAPKAPKPQAPKPAKAPSAGPKAPARPKAPAKAAA